MSMLRALFAIGSRAGASLRQRSAAPLHYVVLALGAVGAAACDGPKAPPPVDDIAWTKELEAQFTGLARLRTSPRGPLAWQGLWPLPEGSTSFGTAAGAGIRLTLPGPARLLGTFTRAGADVLVEPAPGAALTLEDGTPVSGPLKLEHDASSVPTVLRVGGLRVVVHAEPTATARWIRAWDPASPAIAAYQEPPRYAPSRAFRLAAKLTPSSSGQPITLEDITGGEQQFALAGELAVDIAGTTYRMLAFKREGRDSLFVPFRDSTSGNETYGAARYVYVPAPDKDRWTVLDFNKAHNPPCAFTTHSTCALPPKQNRLPVAIRAGERVPATVPARADTTAPATAAPATPRPD
jgi:uncharacterized protein (DUF1684 family)